MKNVRRFKGWSLTKKVGLIVLATAGILIAAVVFAVTVEKNYNYRATSKANSIVLADIIGQNSTAALTFQDPITGYEILSALQAEESILEAVVYDVNGDLFALYTSPEYIEKLGFSEQFAPEMANSVYKPDITFNAPWFTTSREITLAGKAIGRIVLRVDLESLNSYLRTFYWLVGISSIVLLTLMSFICSMLIKKVLMPGATLLKTMDQVSLTQNYNVSVVKENDDELGALIDGFNEMLDGINKRDDELASYRSDLEHLVSVRTKELRLSNQQLLHEIEERKEVQHQLAHAQKMEAIGTLAGGVAHDLNNILSGIVSYPDLLLMQLPKDSPLVKPLMAIRSSGKKAAAIVQDLLTLARRGVKTEERIELKKIIEQYLRSPEFNELLKTHQDVSVRFNSSTGDDFFMKGSSVHLSKTLMNLVANGVEAIANPPGKVTIELGKVVLNDRPAGFSAWRQGEYMQLVVSDDGTGIAEENLERIFEPFFSHKVMGKSGTGLGMSVVWGTVEDHGGHIQVESTVGKGTTFTLYFPSSTAGQLKNNVSSAFNEIKLGTRGEGQVILVVDDSKEQRDLATDILTHLGYQAKVLPSGEEAVTYLKHEAVDLVLLDMIMKPGIDGLETYKQILSFKPEQKVIIASGFSREDSIKEAKRLGISDFVVKPYSVERIAQAIMDVL